MTGWLRWWEFRKRAHCPHLAIRGIFGDEINHTPGYRRLECRRCGRLLDGPVAVADPLARGVLAEQLDERRDHP